MTHRHTDSAEEVFEAHASFKTADRNAYRFRGRSNGTSHRTSATQVESAPQPPRRRSRGRLLIAGLMFAACAAGVLTVWDSLLRYRAYGVVSGRLIEVSAPIGGVLQYVHVREGDDVRQNARLATVSDLEYEHRLARVADELRIADATLHAEIAKVQWQSYVDDTEITRSIAEYFESSGEVHEQSGRLAILRDQLSRTQELSERLAATDSDLQTQTIQERAHQDKMDSLEQSLRVMKERAEKATQIPRMGTEQIEPLIAKADMLLNEIERLREWMSQGDLRAPVNGKVLARHHPAGECVKPHEPLFTVMEESSLEIEMFLPQEMTDDYKVGDTVHLTIEPFEEKVPCIVTQIGSEHVTPPAHIEIFYRESMKLLPVRMRPTGRFATDSKMTIGAVAKLPHFGARG